MEEEVFGHGQACQTGRSQSGYETEPHGCYWQQWWKLIGVVTVVYIVLGEETVEEKERHDVQNKTSEVKRWPRDDQTYFIAVCRDVRRDSHRICLGHHEKASQDLLCLGPEPLTEGCYSGVEQAPPREAWIQVLIASN